MGNAFLARKWLGSHYLMRGTHDTERVLTQLLDDVRDAALEEAAEGCEEWGDGSSIGQAYAAGIRAMKVKP